MMSLLQEIKVLERLCHYSITRVCLRLMKNELMNYSLLTHMNDMRGALWLKH